MRKFIFYFTGIIVTCFSFCMITQSYALEFDEYQSFSLGSETVYLKPTAFSIITALDKKYGYAESLDTSTKISKNKEILLDIKKTINRIIGNRKFSIRTLITNKNIYSQKTNLFIYTYASLVVDSRIRQMDETFNLVNFYKARKVAVNVETLFSPLYRYENPASDTTIEFQSKKKEHEDSVKEIREVDKMFQEETLIYKQGLAIFGSLPDWSILPDYVSHPNEKTRIKINKFLDDMRQKYGENSYYFAYAKMIMAWGDSNNGQVLVQDGNGKWIVLQNAGKTTSSGIGSSYEFDSRISTGRVEAYRGLVFKYLMDGGYGNFTYTANKYADLDTMARNIWQGEYWRVYRDCKDEYSNIELQYRCTVVGLNILNQVSDDHPFLEKIPRK